jgi:hypothetical protein
VSAEKTERAEDPEITTNAERATSVESADKTERASRAESTDRSERATNGESADVLERAKKEESADGFERAEALESTVNPEPPQAPRYGLGYPHIEQPGHHLWAAQQAGWPEHLPYEAWRDLVVIHNTDKAPTASSADHPAFKQDYAPNYLASQEQPEDKLAQHPAVASRQRR